MENLDLYHILELLLEERAVSKMNIELHHIKISELVENFIDNDEQGVVGYNGRLNIRPKYQREFVYDDKMAKAVIQTITKGFPLNVMYWVKNADNEYELLDGQQRTISICRFVKQMMYSDIYFNGTVVRGFRNLTTTEQNKILDYELMVYICEGTDSERLDWFRTINIAGLKLTEQELRNAQFTGEWLTDAKRHFSKNNCAGYHIGKEYINGECDRQFYLQTALSWIADSQGMSIEDYMRIHQHDLNCNEIWLYYTSVFNWVKTIFPKTRKIMNGLPWGIFYNKYGKNSYDANTLEQLIQKLLTDDDVTSKKGIYEYLLSGNEKSLNIRAFTESQKNTMYERQKGICPICKKHYLFEQMEGDHITPWVEGGKTSIDNGQMLCKNCNRRKSSK